MKHSERELRAAAGDMLVARPRSCCGCARPRAQIPARRRIPEYVLSRMGRASVVLVFILVSTICSIDIMFKTVG